MRFVSPFLIMISPLVLSAESKEKIILWGYFTAQIENIEVDPDSTWAHVETYSFENKKNNSEIRSVFVSSMQMVGKQDRWEKVKELKYGDLVKVSISRSYKGKAVPLKIENGVLYIYSDEFEILETKKGEQDAHLR